MKLEYIIKETDNEKTINQILREQFDFSNRLFTKLVKNKLISVNEENIDTRINANIDDCIVIDLDYTEDTTNIVSKKMNLDIIYEDDGLLIINKPAGIAVHPSILHYDNSISSGIKYYFESKKIYKKIRPVNRLDLNTSGLVVFAKNEYIQENLIKQMEKGIFTKKYIAIVEGNFENEKGIIDLPIARKENSIIERCISENGQRAITEYEVLKRNEKYSLIKCNLITGRTHQIRVHMAYIGHPLVGDSLYGRESNIIDRQALHCSEIAFNNPITKKNMKLESKIPKEILQFLYKF